MIDADLARSLSDAGFFYIMHRFNMSNLRFVELANKENWKTISISVGVKPSDIEALNELHTMICEWTILQLILLMVIAL